MYLLKTFQYRCVGNNLSSNRWISAISPPPGTGLFKVLPTSIPAGIYYLVVAIFACRGPEPPVLRSQLGCSSEVIWIRTLVSCKFHHVFAGWLGWNRCSHVDAKIKVVAVPLLRRSSQVIRGGKVESQNTIHDTGVHSR